MTSKLTCTDGCRLSSYKLTARAVWSIR